MNKYNRTNYPHPRSGISGIWDKFVGPGASAEENGLGLISALFFGIGFIAFALITKAEWTTSQFIVAGFLAFDIIGGIVTTATLSATRWYFRSEQKGTDHFKFVVTHVFHIALFGALFTNETAFFIAIYSTLLIVGTLIVTDVPSSIKRSVSNLFVFVAILISFIDFGIDSLMLWFVPAIFLKLFSSYLSGMGEQQ